jgi:hypothetical protein
MRINRKRYLLEVSMIKAFFEVVLMLHEKLRRVDE